MTTISNTKINVNLEEILNVKESYLDFDMVVVEVLDTDLHEDFRCKEKKGRARFLPCYRCRYTAKYIMSRINHKGYDSPFKSLSVMTKKDALQYCEKVIDSAKCKRLFRYAKTNKNDAAWRMQEKESNFFAEWGECMFKPTFLQTF